MNTAKSQHALELFRQGHNCAQSVFAGSGSESSPDQPRRLALTAAFGGGVAHQGELCGALTGALMLLGEQGAQAVALDAEAGKKAINERAEQLIADFRAAHGSILCRELTGCDLATESGKQQFKERNVREQICAKLVADAAERVG